MSKQLLALVKKHKDHFEILENGKIKCSLTEHEIMPTVDAFNQFLKSKGFIFAMENQYDFSQHEPFLVQHKNDGRYLFCNFTGTKLIKRKSVIEKHINGKKFKKMMDLYNEQQKKLEEKNQHKDVHGDDIEDMLNAFEEEDSEQDDEDNEKSKKLLKGKKGTLSKKDKKKLLQEKKLNKKTKKQESNGDEEEEVEGEQQEWEDEEEAGEEEVEEEEEQEQAQKQTKKGLWPWTINQMLTPKFWTHLKHHGFLKTYTRGHMAARHSHYIGSASTEGYVKCKGQDEFGNKYYEDYEVDHRNQRRWVEYSDYFMQMWANSDRIPPAYHGWMNYQYDDFPTPYGPSSFVRPIYQAQHTGNISHRVDTYCPPGHVANFDGRLQFLEDQKNRSRSAWQISAETSASQKKQFQGKKLVQKKQPLFDDVLARE